MQRIDKSAQEKFGIPAIILMENAGRAAAGVVIDMLDKKKIKKVVCVCGKGNNGGDGFVCARHLLNNAVDVDIFLLADPAELKGEAKINYEILERMRQAVKVLKGKRALPLFKDKLHKAGLLIDAIFGIGLRGEIKEPYKGIINLMNQSKKPIIALDVPSGLDATKGKTLGACVKATKTVTFALPKTGFIKDDGPSYIGKLIVVDISIPKIILRT
ncbi:MAG: NAD(P)H-hydrate epimerase [Candidatus Omnitrophica bacterium]|nr:NAD(P)H-hydrate epimerase [Candidatus Omnitrophota bacterium]